MRVVFLDNNLQYDGSTPDKQPLGGSETALVNMAREFAKRGHDVRVYNRCLAPGVFDGVQYKRFDSYVETAYLEADVTIALRNAALLNGFTNSLVTVLWMQDAFNQQILQPLRDSRLQVLIDQIFFVSQWQAWSFLRCYEWPRAQTWVSRNGVNLAHFPERALAAPRGKRVCYTSTPFRGLGLLLQLWPRILKAVPDAELHVHSNMGVYQVPADQDQKDFGEIYKALRQPGVFGHGGVNQVDLAKALASYRIFAYPNTFHETGCIALVEAMAAGCGVVTSDQGALPEILGGGGRLVSDVPGSAAYNDSFVDNTVALLQDDAAWQEMSVGFYERAHALYGWEKIAQEWEGRLVQLVAEQKRNRKRE